MGVCNISFAGSGGVHSFAHDVGPFSSREVAAVWLTGHGFVPYRDGWLKKGEGDRLVFIYKYDARGKNMYRSGPVKRIFAKINLQYSANFVSFEKKAAD